MRNRDGVLCALGLLAATGATQAQNLLGNPNFDAGLSSWTATPSGTCVFDATQGSPVAGSALCTNSNSLPDPPYPPGQFLGQSVPFPAERPIQFGGMCRNPSGQASTGGCLVAATFFDSGGAFLAAYYRGSGGQPDDTWLSLSWPQPLLAPPGAASVRFSFQVEKNVAGGSHQASFDSAYLRLAATKGDFHDDGQVDLVLHNQVNGDNRLWRMNGVQRLSTTLISPDATGRSIVASDDFNGDRKSDLVMLDDVTRAVEFWFMDGPARVGAAVPLSGASPLSANWKLSASGDFNHDNQPDLLWRNTSSQKLVVWTLSGTTKVGSVTPTPDQAADANWSVAAALDFNNDSNRDLLWYNASSGKVVLWRMDANLVRLSGNFTSPDSAGSSSWKVVAGGDYGLGPAGVFNANDVVWRNSASGKFVVWHMDPYSNPLKRTSGEFTSPDAPANALDWTIVGPK